MCYPRPGISCCRRFLRLPEEPPGSLVAPGLPALLCPQGLVQLLGCELVALAAGGLKEVVLHNVTGFLVDPDLDPAAAIAGHLRALAKDRGRVVELQRAARRDYLDRFTVDAMVARAEPAYYAAARAKR